VAPAAAPAVIWFGSRAEYDRDLAAGLPARRRQDQEIARRESWPARCAYCHEEREFTVSVGLRFGDEIDLRSGLVCRGCGLNNRQRLLYHALEDQAGGPAGLESLRLYVAERLSLFYERLAERAPHLVGSEYLSPSLASGQTRPVARSRPETLLGAVASRLGFPVPQVRHEDLKALSFPAESFDLVVHGDVLEHISDPRRALAEIHRVLAPGGATVFTAPFLAGNDANEVRAVVDPDGSVRHLLPPEIHGNPIADEGSLVFQTFGWAVLDDLRAAGFEAAAVGVMADPTHAFTSNNSAYANYMEPIVFRGEKAGARTEASPG
jgi:SAM-dependent methyltransferase